MDRQFLLFTLLPLLAMLVGFGMLVLAWVDDSGGKAAEAWPRVEGMVEKAEIRRIPGGEAADEYELALIYHYRVGTQDYRSIQFAFGGAPRHADARMLEDALQQYAAGQRVTVHYNPKAPSEAVLRPGSGSNTARQTNIGAGLVAIGMVAWFAWHGL
jgi:hypothetical protein